MRLDEEWLKLLPSTVLRNTWAALNRGDLIPEYSDDPRLVLLAQ